MTDNQTTSPLNRIVFFTASGCILLLLTGALLAPEQAEQLFSYVQAGIVDNGSWFYVMTVAIILTSTLFLGLSRYGEIKLGPDHASPDYPYITWLSMLFAAGMGIGLMFFGVAEPLMHYLSPPTATAGTVDAVREAMKMTFFHWGLHAWAIYAVVALILAYFSFRLDLPLTLRSALFPIIGNKIYGWPGHLVDIFAVISTVFGVATSLGIGVLQINAGLNYLLDVPESLATQISLIIGITLLAVISVVSGLDKGIRRLSELNMALAVGLLLLVLIMGPTVFLLTALMQNTGAYLSDIVRNTFNLFAYQKTDWLGGWTIFYWGWWLAWAPFVGVFIARISRGRTLREFLMGVLFVPSAFTLVWMTFFGNSAIDMVFNHGNEQLGSLANDNTPVALFLFLEQFPWSSLLSVIAIAMVVVFFVTSCDSGAMVVDMLCSNGNNNTPLWQRIYWASSVGLVAAILLLAGGLNALQTMTIASALPFAIVLLLALFGLFKALRVEAYKRESLAFSPLSITGGQHQESWKERLHTIVDYPSLQTVSRFINTTVKNSCLSFAEELQGHHFECTVSEVENGILLTVSHGDQPHFEYAVYCVVHQQPEFAHGDQPTLDSADDQTYYRAEVHLSEGGQNYDIMGWSKTAVINDIVDQYHKHLHFLHLLQ
ncbi:choline BCCT transporter BetT [Aestuariibacter halophilus]|uniref:Choline BCCT transporter BetT n=1 Tax=Fluctibacter halophilus TaxID=226011 RepID=A0ABS8G752_9ALTE|nr:choline BCCT transporter BetT [Aestuariibacter halophilus]MCC2616370.1 choline BCCT transporter BetT [Aestuariibacter halophilus]